MPEKNEHKKHFGTKVQYVYKAGKSKYRGINSSLRESSDWRTTFDFKTQLIREKYTVCVKFLNISPTNETSTR